MTNKSRVIYVGRHKRPVTIKGLLPEEYLAVATGMVKMSEALEHELRACSRLPPHELPRPCHST